MALVFWCLVFVALLTVLWKVSSAAKCGIKWLLLGIFATLAATLPVPLMLLSPRDSKNALIPSAILRTCCKFIGVTLHVEGKENIVKGGSVILINHQSMLDLLVLAYLWPVMDNCTVIAKKEVLYIQPFALGSWLWGTIFINRVNSKDAQTAVNRTGEIIKRRKARVLIFPEGTRNLGNSKLLPFKKGAFHLALASDVPIQPVAVSRFSFLGNLKFEDGHIKVRILPAIETKNATKDDIPRLIEETKRVLQTNVDDLSSPKSNGYSKSTDYSKKK